MQWLKSAIEAISSLLCRSPEAQVQRLKIKEQKRANKEYQKNQYRRIFAHAEIEELILMRELVDSNNTPQVMTFDIDKWYREVKKDGVKENLYQVVGVKTIPGPTPWIDAEKYDIVRITITVFDDFKKEFNKYGRNRIPENYEKGKR